VRGDSGIGNIDELVGKKIAFVSPMGAGGYLAPRAFFYENGVKTGQQAEESFTKNLSNSIYRVLLGEVDAGAMCGINFDLMSRKIDTGDIKIIAQSADYPENVIGARRDLDPELLGLLRTTIIGMWDSRSGRRILEDMHRFKIERFVPYDPGLEDITVRFLEAGELNGAS
jgi:phosphonate transport system substrate-binding protein